MKNYLMTFVFIGFILSGCAGTGDYNTWKGSAIGAGLGGLVGQAIGHDAEATLIGAGIGSVVGGVIGNIEDQKTVAQPVFSQTEPAPQPQVRYEAPVPQVKTDPPGQWVTVPGHWEGTRWIPEHQEWRPIHPY
jgi:hypothetical protein